MKTALLFSQGADLFPSCVGSAYQPDLCPWALNIHLFSDELMETIVIVSVARMGVKYLKNINSEMVSDYASSILLLVMILTFDHLNGNCLS